MNDLNDLRSAWRDTTAGLDNKISYSDQQLRQLVKRQTTVERLAARYRRFSIISIAAIPLGGTFMMPQFSHFADGWIMTVLYVLILGTCAIFDRWFYRQISAIDCITQPVSEVSARAMLCRRLHLRFVAVGLPLVALLMLCGGWVVFHDVYYLVSMGFGMVVGGLIGLKFLLQFMRDYRALRDD